jgi:hypothetical protein
MFKLRAQNVLFWALAPTMIARHSYNQAINDRVDNLWRIHENRQKRGLGGTAKKNGWHEGHNQDTNFQINGGFHVHIDTLKDQVAHKPYFNN